MTTQSYGNFISGRRVSAGSGLFEATNPTTGAVWGTFTDSRIEDVDAAVSSAHTAFTGDWGRVSASERGRLMLRWGDLILANAERLARIETGQNGKLLSEMLAQVRVVPEWLAYYGGLADKIEGSVIPLKQTSVLNYTLKEPLGVIAVIVPWNSPLLLAIMAIAPALSAGNAIVLKPSEVTSASAIEIAALAIEAGFPAGVINVVTGAREAGAALVEHPLVAKISFAGGEEAGRAIAARAGQRLVGCTLELGGKSPNIVFDDADLDLAEAGVLGGIFAAAGQSCVAGSRAYIQRGTYDRLVDRLVSRASKIRIGDPLEAGTQMGPLASTAQLRKTIDMVARAKSDGADVLGGGGQPSIAGYEGGFFFEPTILGGAAADSFIMQNEVFGPVLCVTPFDDEDEIVEAANATRFGLAAGVWTNDLRRAHRMARAIKAGTVWINTYRALTYNSPFGGYKNSGQGRLNGVDAVNAFLQTKSVWCELGTAVNDPFVIRA
ncbi:aldehyde dehydrogenase (NAD+) [Chelatococcus asaccharovorans]|uniref:Aldehyde dehydrogenase (NAD+) n=2 Tax=Chelatococcus asaccharovorans TaxID=28210 RepID=A0A2V3UGB4_9HYPH|nr:aldehyde dehydrogenase [Chelatococcus asaccharovorans]PXW57886.1 aldehyde dehydrogenase (NAD+) [Chelatococcus asaccharovorans]